ncbi:MAG: HIT domain-containing protein [Acidimicrobiales bacterium]
MSDPPTHANSNSEDFATAADNALHADGFMTRMWSGWRLPYITRSDDHRTQDVPTGVSIFEGIFRSGLPDESSYILWRGDTCFALMNAFPYTTGHLMVLPQRAVTDLEGLTDDEYTELWLGVRKAVHALKTAFRPQGVNVGLNLGAAAGAGFPDHLHVHCLPRWAGDTNFMTTVAETRVLPETIADSWTKLRAAWPTD